MLTKSPNWLGKTFNKINLKNSNSSVFFSIWISWLINLRNHKMIGLNHFTNPYCCRPIWMVGRCILAFFFRDGCRSVIKFVNHACSQNEVEKEKILLQKMSRKSNHNIGFNKFCYPKNAFNLNWVHNLSTHNVLRSLKKIYNKVVIPLRRLKWSEPFFISSGNCLW